MPYIGIKRHKKEEEEEKKNLSKIEYNSLRIV
jgi:hypothetical protein